MAIANSSTTPHMASHALRYASLGFYVFPLAPGAKTPLHKGGVNKSTRDPVQITAWWRNEPTANIGLALFPAGMMVVDLDVKPKKGVDGRETLIDLETLEGELGGLVQRTASGGTHRLFKALPGCIDKVGWAKGIDILCASHRYIVAAPSVVNGVPYEWEDGLAGLDLGEDLPTLPEAWKLLLGGGEVPRERTIDPDDNGTPDLLDTAALRVSGATIEELDSILDTLDPEMGRDPWLKVIWGAAAQWSGTAHEDEVIDKIEQWSKRTTVEGQYKTGEVAKRWREHRARSGGKSGAGHTTWRGVRSMAKRAGWLPTSLNGITSRNWRDNMITKETKGGMVWTDDAWNLALILCFHDDLAGSVRKNVLTGAIEIHKQSVSPLSDPTMLPVVYNEKSDWIGVHKVLSGLVVGEPSRDNINASVRMAADIHCIDPLKRDLEALVWDGVPRLDEWLVHVTGCANSAINRAMGRAWMIGMASRGMAEWYGRGAKMDSVLVLCSKEGLGKSTIGEILGGEWYAKFSSSMNNDDIYYVIEKRLVLELDELDSLSRTEATRIKSIVTSQVDTFRRKYDAQASDKPRRCVFIGTTNDHEFLTRDMTMRRWWVVRCSDRQFRLQWLRQHRDQLVAEAIAMWEKGELPMLPDGLRTEHAALVEDARVEHPYEVAVKEWTVRQPVGSELSIRDVVEGVLSRPLTNLTMAELRKLGDVMRDAGWRKKAMNNRKVWVRVV